MLLGQNGNGIYLQDMKLSYHTPMAFIDFIPSACDITITFRGGGQGYFCP